MSNWPKRGAEDVKDSLYSGAVPWVLIEAAVHRHSEAWRPGDVHAAEEFLIQTLSPLRRRPRGTVIENRKRDIIERDGGACIRCGSSEDLEVDHLLPQDMGGCCQEFNLTTLCYRCNKRKGAGIQNWAMRLMVRQAMRQEWQGEGS